MSHVFFSIADNEQIIHLFKAKNGRSEKRHTQSGTHIHIRTNIIYYVCFFHVYICTYDASLAKPRWKTPPLFLVRALIIATSLAKPRWKTPPFILLKNIVTSLATPRWKTPPFILSKHIVTSLATPRSKTLTVYTNSTAGRSPAFCYFLYNYFKYY